MDIKAYIESGILESYVMRLTSPEESAEVESMMAAHPEIADAVNEFEIRLEQQLMDNAVSPGQQVKQHLFAALESEFAVPGKVEEARIIPMQRTTPFWKYVAAASIILFLGSTILNVHYYSKYSEVQNSYNTLLADRTSLMANLNANQTRLNILDSSMRMIKDTAMAVIQMKGKNNVATVYWDTRTKDVYVLQNEMPKAPQGKQYQLWAIVDGKTINAGMLENCEAALCKMANIPQAQAFAITLEKEGGSPTPDMEHLMVFGKI